jgi:AAA domain
MELRMLGRSGLKVSTLRLGGNVTPRSRSSGASAFRNSDRAYFRTRPAIYCATSARGKPTMRKQSMAREHGLLELLGQDKVQAIVSGAEDDPMPAPPPEANGAGPGMLEQPGDPGPAAPSETPHGPPQPLAPWWRDPATIPPRRYLFGGHYVRLAVGVTIGAGGRAKTTLGCCEAVGMAVGRDLMIDKPLPDGPLRVWMLNSEEDQDELDRRISAVCQRYEIAEADLGGRLYAQSVRDKPMRIAAMVGGVPMLVRVDCQSSQRRRGAFPPPGQAKARPSQYGGGGRARGLLRLMGSPIRTGAQLHDPGRSRQARHPRRRAGPTARTRSQRKPGDPYEPPPSYRRTPLP